MAKPKSNVLVLPDAIINQLSNADTQYGFPPGTMASLMQQETSNNPKYISNPATYHYAIDTEGKRKSTARGPFGILDSTGDKPGYGVTPLADRNSFADHLRFAAEYLRGRTNAAGGDLSRGLAGYGEGTPYAAAIIKRRDGGAPTVPVVPPTLVAQATRPTTVPAAVTAAPVAAPPVAPAGEPAPVVAAAPPDAWQAYLDQYQKTVAEIKAKDLEYGQKKEAVVAAPPDIEVPDFMASLNGMGQSAPPTAFNTVAPLTTPIRPTGRGVISDASNLGDFSTMSYNRSRHA
jgi:hypothetical protein